MAMATMLAGDEITIFGRGTRGGRYGLLTYAAMRRALDGTLLKQLGGIFFESANTLHGRIDFAEHIGFQLEVRFLIHDLFCFPGAAARHYTAR